MNNEPTDDTPPHRTEPTQAELEAKYLPRRESLRRYRLKRWGGCLLFVLLAFAGVSYGMEWFLKEQVRSKLSRPQSDMRSLETALLSFYIDHARFPPWTWATDPGSIWQGRSPRGVDIPTFAIHDENGTPIYPTLTTPTSYLTTYFNDSFSPGSRESFGYIAGDDGFLLICAGPNARSDYPELPFTPDDPEAQHERMLPYIYDPTNGTTSSGDLLRFVWRDHDGDWQNGWSGRGGSTLTKSTTSSSAASIATQRTLIVFAILIVVFIAAMIYAMPRFDG